MRKIRVGMHVTLDGVVEAPEQWSFQYQNEETGAVIFQDMANCDALLLGRTTYQTFAASFAGQSGGVADIMNGLAKYVVSNTLQKAEWNNSIIVKGNIPEEIARLKAQPGKDIGLSGSGTLLQTLIQHDLIDVYTLLVYPIVLGRGKRLFDEGTQASLRLLQARPLSSGVVHLVYEPQRR